MATIGNLTYNNVIEKILKEFPEYKTSEEYFDDINVDLPYIVLGNLGLMALEDLDDKTDTSMAEKLLRITDDVLNNPNSDDKILDLFQVQIFEKLTAYKKGAILAKKILRGKSLELLEQTLEYYNTEEFLEEYRKK